MTMTPSHSACNLFQGCGAVERGMMCGISHMVTSDGGSQMAEFGAFCGKVYQIVSVVTGKKFVCTAQLTISGVICTFCRELLFLLGNPEVIS